VPEGVYNEVVTRGQGRPGAVEVAQATWIEQRVVEDLPILESLPLTLHRGESEAIALAIYLGSQLLTDEYKGREAARENRVEVIGSLAVPAEAKRRGFIEHVRPLVSELITSGYWLDAGLVVIFRKKWGSRQQIRWLHIPALQRQGLGATLTLISKLSDAAISQSRHAASISRVTQELRRRLKTI
jgi:predicted nucleic acid-binding protein